MFNIKYANYYSWTFLIIVTIFYWHMFSVHSPAWVSKGQYHVSI